MARIISAPLRALDFALSAAVVVALFATDERWQAAASREPVHGLIFCLIAAVLVPISLDILGLYQSQRRETLGRVAFRFALAGALATTMLIASAAALGKLSGVWWLPLAGKCGVIQLAVLVSSRWLLFAGLHRFRRGGRDTRNIVIVGSGARARNFTAEVAAHPEWGLEILAFLDDEDRPHDPQLRDADVRKLQDFPELVRSEVIDEVVIACPRSMLESVMPVVAVCAETGLQLTMLSDLFGDHLPQPVATQYGGLSALGFAPAYRSPTQLAVKRLLDIVGAVALLVLFAPVIAIAALSIRLTSPGRAIFRQRRCGLHAREFEMYKLRSMCADAEALQVELVGMNEMDGPCFKMRHDPRVTTVGRFIRKFSIDELPQLWNVLQGDMSLVGPRPAVPSEVLRYSSSERRRLSMRPGLTCLWQIGGRNAIGFEGWVKLDLQYIDAWSFWMDLNILLSTPRAVLRGDGL